MSSEDKFFSAMTAKDNKPFNKVEFFKGASFFSLVDTSTQKLANMEIPMPNNKGTGDFGFGQGLANDKTNPLKLNNKPVDMFKAPNQPDIMKSAPNNPSGSRGFSPTAGKDTGFNPI